MRRRERTHWVGRHGGSTQLINTLTMELSHNLTQPHTEHWQTCWDYLAMLLIPITSILCNAVFIGVVRHSRCFSSPTSHYMVSLAAAQILLALVNQIPTMVVYTHSIPDNSGCFYLTTLDMFALTISPMHFLAIIWHRLAETKYFQFLVQCHVRLPAFILPWLLTILVTIAAVTDFSIGDHPRQRRTDGDVTCLLTLDECWVWIVPLSLDVVVAATATALWVIGRRTKNTSSGISIVNRCSGDWTKSMALVFIDPNDLVNLDEGDGYASMDGDRDLGDNHVEYTGLTATNTHAEICDAILERDLSSSEKGHEGKTFQTLVEEEILEPDTNALLLNDAVITVSHHRPPPSHTAVGHALRTACVTHVTPIIEALYVSLQLPCIVVNVISCIEGATRDYVVLMRMLKWLALLPGLIVPILHMTLMPATYKTLISDKINRVVLTVGQFNRYHRA